MASQEVVGVLDISCWSPRHCRSIGLQCAQYIIVLTGLLWSSSTATLVNSLVASQTRFVASILSQEQSKCNADNEGRSRSTSTDKTIMIRLWTQTPTIQLKVSAASRKASSREQVMPDTRTTLCPIRQGGTAITWISTREPVLGLDHLWRWKRALQSEARLLRLLIGTAKWLESVGAGRRDAQNMNR